MAETPQEIQAREQREREERERQERNARQAGWLDTLRGFLPDFSFFGLLEMLVVGVGAYFLATTNMGKGALGSVIGMLPTSWQANALGLLNMAGIEMDMRATLEGMDYAALHTFLKDQASPEILEIIDPNDGNKTLKEFLAIVANANPTDDGRPGPVTKSTLMSDKTIVAIIQQKPEMARALVTAALTPRADGTANPTGQQMMAAIKGIVAGPQLDALLSPANRANTIHILAAALPRNVPINEAGLIAIINRGLDANGRPTPQLRQLFTSMIDSQMATPATGTGAATGAATAVSVGNVTQMVGIANVAMMLDVSKINDPAAKYAVTMLQQDPKAKAAFVALVSALGEAQTGTFITTLQAPDAGNQLAQFFLKQENVHALPQAVALLDALPALAGKMPHDQAVAFTRARQFLTPAHIPAIIAIANKGVSPLVLMNNFMPNGAFDIDRALNVLQNPVNRSIVATAGTANIAALIHEANPLATQRNLDAIIKFIGSIDHGRPSPQSALIIHRLARLVTDVSMHDALQGLNGEQLAAFFSVSANRNAFKALLDKNTGLHGTTPAMQHQLDLLREDFDKGPGVGLGAILSDKDSAQFLLDHSNGAGFSTGSTIVDRALGLYFDPFNQNPGKRAAMWAMGGQPLANFENQSIILELSSALNEGAPVTPRAPARVAWCTDPSAAADSSRISYARASLYTA